MKKTKQFSMDIGYKRKEDTRINRAKHIHNLGTNFLAPRKVSTSEETFFETTAEKQIKACDLMKTIDPKNLLERLELLILETKTVHDGLYDEMYLNDYYLWT